MVAEAVEAKVHDAASKGDAITLEQLLEKDTFLVHGAPFACSRNLLHIATMCGQVGLVEEILNTNPRLARNTDSQKWSPLHIAAAEGNVEIAKRLLPVAPEMGWWRDDQGMNPVHIAAVRGRVEVVDYLIGVSPLPAMERVNRGETVLHLCVKHGQLRALEVLVEKLGKDLVHAKDDDGETLLHLAVRSGQLEIVRYLDESNKIKKLAPNSMGKTALDILNESFQNTSTYKHMKIILKSLSDLSILQPLPKMTDMTMVVAVLIATMAFQASVSPPGGVWQDDTSSHRAGKAVMASTHPKIYKQFTNANTIAFASSLITILLITTGGPSIDLFFLAIALYAIWLSIASIAVSHGASVIMTNPSETVSIGFIAVNVVAVFVFVFLLVFFYFPIHELWLWMRKKLRRWEDFTPFRWLFIWLKPPTRTPTG